MFEPAERLPKPFVSIIQLNKANEGVPSSSDEVAIPTGTTFDLVVMKWT